MKRMIVIHTKTRQYKRGDTVTQYGRVFAFKSCTPTRTYSFKNVFEEVSK